jgi:hypothetical protein
MAEGDYSVLRSTHLLTARLKSDLSEATTEVPNYVGPIFLEG